jgi:putative ABC transport system permease protein
MKFSAIETVEIGTPLTALGIVIGAGAAIMLIAAGNSAYGQIRARAQDHGADLIVIAPGTGTRLTAQDAATIKRHATLISAVSPVIVSPVIVSPVIVAPVIVAPTQAVRGQGHWRIEVNGVATDYLTIRHWTVASGVPFDNDDVRAKRRYALLGRTVASKLFPDTDPFGARLRLGDVAFTVVGVLADSDQENIVLVPYTTVQDGLSEIVATTTGHADIGAVEDQLRGILRTAHRLGHGAPDDFTIHDQTTLVDNLQESR